MIDAPPNPIVRRDQLAAWLPVADEFLQAMDRDDPRYAAGLEEWRLRLGKYEALCEECPE